MSDNDRAEINVTIGDDTIQLILPGDGWQYDEAKIAKEVSGGMPPAEIERSFFLQDPDAWMAVMRVSYLRAGKDFPSALLRGQDLMAFMREVDAAIEEARRNRPPTNQSQNGSGEPSGSEEIVETVPQSLE